VPVPQGNNHPVMSPYGVFARRSAADATAHRNAHARGLALEGAQHQLAALHPVEARPVEVGQRVEDKRRKVGGVRGGVALAFEQRARLGGKLGISLGLGRGGGAVEGEHRISEWSPIA